MLKKIENQECIIKIDEDIERFLQHQAIQLNMPFSSRTEVLKKFIHTLDVNISGQDPISFEMAQQYAKENQIKQAIFILLEDQEKVESIFKVIRRQDEY